MAICINGHLNSESASFCTSCGSSLSAGGVRGTMISPQGSGFLESSRSTSEGNSRKLPFASVRSVPSSRLLSAAGMVVLVVASLGFLSISVGIAVDQTILFTFSDNWIRIRSISYSSVTVGLVLIFLGVFSGAILNFDRRGIFLGICHTIVSAGLLVAIIQPIFEDDRLFFSIWASWSPLYGIMSAVGMLMVAVASLLLNLPRRSPRWQHATSGRSLASGIISCIGIIAFGVASVLAKDASHIAASDYFASGGAVLLILSAFLAPRTGLLVRIGSILSGAMFAINALLSTDVFQPSTDVWLWTLAAGQTLFTAGLILFTISSFKRMR